MKLLTRIRYFLGLLTIVANSQSIRLIEKVKRSTSYRLLFCSTCILTQKLSKIYFFIILAIFVVSCDPEGPIVPPIEYPGEVIFSMKGTLDGDSLIIEAGKKNVRLYADFRLNADNIYEFQGAFEKSPSCTSDCVEALSVMITNDKIGTSVNISDALFIGDYSWIDEQIDTTINYQVSFEPVATATSFIGANWNFGDNNTSNALVPIHTFENNFPLVELETYDLFNNRSRVKTHLDLENGTDCQEDFYFLYNSISDIYTFKIPDASQNLTYNWTLTDGVNVFTNTGANFVRGVSSNDLFEVCLEVNNNGCLSQICKVYDNNSQTLVSATTFAYEIEPVNIVSIDQFLSKITLNYTSPDGIFYSSQNGIQPSSSTFEILEIEDYSEGSLDIKKIKATLNCVLFDANGNSLTLETNEFTFGVDYPN